MAVRCFFGCEDQNPRPEKMAGERAGCRAQGRVLRCDDLREDGFPPAGEAPGGPGAVGADSRAWAVDLGFLFRLGFLGEKSRHIRGEGTEETQSEDWRDRDGAQGHWPRPEEQPQNDTGGAPFVDSAFFDVRRSRWLMPRKHPSLARLEMKLRWTKCQGNWQ